MGTSCQLEHDTPAAHHVITACTNLSAVVPYQVRGGLNERVTLWCALTEGFNHVFIKSH